jgi:hypothetical protein
MIDSDNCGAISGINDQPWMIDSDNCGAISGINEWQGKVKY